MASKRRRSQAPRGSETLLRTRARMVQSRIARPSKRKRAGARPTKVPPTKVRQPLRRPSLADRLVVTFTGAGAAENFSAAPDLAAKVDSFAATFANYALSLVPRKFLGRKLHVHPLGLEHLVIRQSLVSQHLGLVLVGDFRMHAPG